MSKDKKKKMGRSQFEIIKAIAETADVKVASVKSVFEAFSEVLADELSVAHQCKVAGLFNVKAIKKPAVKGGQEKTNPFNGEKYITKDKPAKTVIKIIPLKKLKGMV